MGEDNCWEREVVITELTKGRELMCQLQKHFDPMKQDVCQYLSVEILSSYDKALSLLNGTALSRMSKGKQIINSAPSSSTAKLESPHLPVDSSTKSSDRPFNSRKRKMISRRTEYVHARSGEEVPPEDGYSWRKYGQKYILGAKHPRAPGKWVDSTCPDLPFTFGALLGVKEKNETFFPNYGVTLDQSLTENKVAQREYYRCARRRLSSCTATKMVQRSETEASVFEVIYGGSHSCGQESKLQQNGELVAGLTKETQCDEVGRKGEISESYFPEMVSTPNTSFNNSSTGIVNSNSILNMTSSDFMMTPTSAHAEGNSSAEDLWTTFFSSFK